MKYSKLHIALFIGIIMVIFCLSASADGYHGKTDLIWNQDQNILGKNSPPERTNPNSLPASLIEIGESAFEGTALSNISLPDNIETIEDRAFAENDQMFAISIPKTVESIGREAFTDNKKLIIQTETGTYAKYWAQRQGVPYVVVPFLIAPAENKPDGFLQPALRTRQKKALRSGTCLAEKKENQTGRSSGEIKLPKYKGNASELIQSRYFP